MRISRNVRKVEPALKMGTENRSQRGPWQDRAHERLQTGWTDVCRDCCLQAGRKQEFQKQSKERQLASQVSQKT